MSDDFTPTPAGEYPISRVLELELPSGAKVRVKKPSVYLLKRTGAIPASVQAIIERTGGDPAEMTEDERAELLDFMTAASFVEPKVSLTPRADHVCLADIQDEDRNAVVVALNMRV